MDALIDEVTQRIAAIPNLPSGTRLPQVSDLTTPSLARLIDHTLLKPEATSAQVIALCHEAREYSFASVCVNPIFVPTCADVLTGSQVIVCTVVGFPLGANATQTKVLELRLAHAAGARELDVVLSIGRLKAGEWYDVACDLHEVIAACHERQALVKVIIETALLTEREKIAACLLATHVGADFVKTSTGFAGGGATVADIRLMRQVVGPDVGVKASGGVRTRADAQAMVDAGATRIGTSAGIAIVSSSGIQSRRTH